MRPTDLGNSFKLICFIFETLVQVPESREELVFYGGERSNMNAEGIASLLTAPD